MKKSLLLLFSACAMLSPLALSAQKKTKAKTTPVVEKPVLKNEADTISYAFGATIAQQGLKSYMYQMNVLVDTTAFSEDYMTRISEETDPVKQDKLNKELNFKLDSINKANEVNMKEFIAGFNQTLNQDKSKSAFNSGAAIGSQLFSMTDNLSKEMLGGEGRFNTAAFAAAFTSSLKDEKLLIENTEEIVQNASMKAQQTKATELAESMKLDYAQQIAEGEEFMAENKTKDGVVTLPNGLQYKVITEGKGQQPTETDRVTVNYEGTLIDGTVFDSSIERGEPATFGVNQVIKGWTEALLLMPLGSKWILYIPYDLAYGERDQGVIKPFSNLIFTVELLEIEE